MRNRSLLVLMLVATASIRLSAATLNRLPTGQILTPAGTSLDLDGTMAANILRIPGKPWVAVICSGARQSLSIVDTETQKVLSTVEFQQVKPGAMNYTATGDAYYGLALNSDGTVLYASRGSEDRVASYNIGSDGSLTESTTFSEPPPSPTTANFVSGLAFDPASSTIYAANNLSNTLAAFHATTVASNPTKLTQPAPPATRPQQPTVYAVKGYPLSVVADDLVHKVYVSSERDSSLSVIDTNGNSAPETINVGSHPDALLVSNDGARLFVANGDSDTISIVNTSDDAVLRTIPLRPSPVSGLPGATPTGLVLSPDQRTLYVTLADLNAVGVVRLTSDLTDGRVIGYIPTGWYPTAVTLNATGSLLVVANAKGSAAVHPNPLGPTPMVDGNTHYIHDLLVSSLSFIPVPGAATLKLMTKKVLSGNAITQSIDPDSVKVTSLLAHLPIKHVIYIIKENRTYDEVLGDLPQGNGDPSLVLFGKNITPNLHALATDFVTLDNFYCCAEVSADGWNWSTSGFADEYVQRSVPEDYSEKSNSARRSVRGYDYEGENEDKAVSNLGVPDVAESPGGYIWDSVKKSGLSYRDYGAFLAGDGSQASKPALLTHTDYDFAGFDLKYADSDAYFGLSLPSPGENIYGPRRMPSRFTAWNAEFQKYVANGNLPAFELVRFMRDHTSGTATGANTPQAMLADNDYAVGELVDTVSHSKYWKNTAIFVVEDDAQNGPDHVDCHRSTCYVISPYIKRKSVDHHFYNTDSVLRTMEILLHTPAMTRLDKSAPPIGAFVSAPNTQPFDAIFPDQKLLGSFNTASSFGAEQSIKMDFAVADDIPEDALNNILWRSIKGKNSPMPQPRHTVLGE